MESPSKELEEGYFDSGNIRHIFPKYVLRFPEVHNIFPVQTTHLNVLASNFLFPQFKHQLMLPVSPKAFMDIHTTKKMHFSLERYQAVLQMLKQQVYKCLSLHYSWIQNVLKHLQRFMKGKRLGIY